MILVRNQWAGGWSEIRNAETDQTVTSVEEAASVLRAERMDGPLEVIEVQVVRGFKLVPTIRVEDFEVISEESL